MVFCSYYCKNGREWKQVPRSFEDKNGILAFCHGLVKGFLASVISQPLATNSLMQSWY